MPKPFFFHYGPNSVPYYKYPQESKKAFRAWLRAKIVSLPPYSHFVAPTAVKYLPAISWYVKRENCAQGAIITCRDLGDCLHVVRIQ